MASPPLKIVLATGNRGKLRELRALLADLDVELQTVADVLGRSLEVDEDRDSFEGNAAKKAVEAAAATGHVALADDSGLEVDALGGAPGVYSARYAGGGGDDANNEKLLAAIASVPDEQRTARFRCVLALAVPGQAKPALLADGRCEGRIARERRGNGGFGYDPLFVVAGQGGATMAELPAATKNSLSHRAVATRKLREALPAFLARHAAVD